MVRLSIVSILAIIFFAAQSMAADDLAGDFVSPPDSARPWVYYFIMDGNLTREGITADFEAMRAAGIGGAIIMEVNVGIPQGPVKFMSPEWRQLFKHAVLEAQRLGLNLTLNAGPGWTGSGGPWVRPEQSMQHLVASETAVRGPGKFDAVLARPKPRPPYFGVAGLPQDLLKAQNEFYADVAVVAVPATDPTRRIEDIDEKAIYLRHPYTSRPGTKPFIAAPTTFPVLPAAAVIPASSMIDLTKQMKPDGRLEWDVPPGEWTVLRFGRTSTGANSRPAPIPGLGLECDKFDKAALDGHFDNFVGSLLREIGADRGAAGAGWTSLHIDSWEMGAQNWTARFADEFRRRRGYDLMLYLPVFTGRVVSSFETSERFLWDVRETGQELVIENHARRLKELGARHGLGLSIEPYDMNPCADLSLGGVADVPMCEFWRDTFDSTFSVIEAASIAHTLGRPIVAAESFTSGDGERWLAYPGSIKALGDWALCAGVNRIVFHRYQHQPALDRAPGMTMGPYGVHWERTQTWWDMVGAYHAYLARCQAMLRRGLSVADVLYLSAEGAPHVLRPPSSAIRGNPPDRLGYNFDGCAPETLINRVSVKDGRLVLPDGMSYRVLVLPERQTMTPALLRKVKELAEAGATVIGPRALKSPSLSGFPRCDQQVKTLADALWGDCDGKVITERAVGKGRIVWFASQPRENEQYGDFAIVANVLRRMGVAPDFDSDVPLRYTHRSDGDTDIYFIANPSPRDVVANVAFRVAGKQPELWFADSGRTTSARQFEQLDGRTRLALKLDPGGSLFVVFRKPLAAPVAAQSGRNWDEYVTIATISGPWEINFQSGRGAPASIRLDTLADLSKHPDAAVRHFSGKAIYRTTLAWPPPTTRPSALEQRVFVDLGRVAVTAQVKVNGKDLGIAWKTPFRIELTPALRSGENQIEITVANLWPNRLIGDAALPPAQRVAQTTWNPFTKDAPLPESGLLGLVTVQICEP